MLKILKRQSYGFTLLELLVVMIIVGLLASITLPIYTGITNRARQTEAENTVGEILTSEWLVFQENGAFSIVDGDLLIQWDETFFDYVLAKGPAGNLKTDVQVTATGIVGQPTEGLSVKGVITNVGIRKIS